MSRIKPSHFLLLSFLVILLAGTSCRKRAIRDLEYDPQFSITHDGMKRTYLLHVPQAYWDDGTQSVPLLFALHGGGGDGESMINLTLGGFNTLSDAKNFIVVYPEGVENSWNDGRGTDAVRAQELGIDDIGFFEALIDSLSAEYRIDQERIFATGISNGGFMSSRLGTDLGHKMAAIAPVAAGIAKPVADTANAELPVPVMLINGTLDPLVPYEGNTVQVTSGGATRGEKLTVPETVVFWTDKNNCDDFADESNWDNEPRDGTEAFHSVYDNCDQRRQVELFKIEGGGHTWPSGWQYLGEKLIGRTSKEIDACVVIWTFFEAHPRQ